MLSERAGMHYAAKDADSLPLRQPDVGGLRVDADEFCYLATVPFDALACPGHEAPALVEHDPWREPLGQARNVGLQLCFA